MGFWSLHRDLFSRPDFKTQLDLTPRTGQDRDQAIDRRREVAEGLIELLRKPNMGPELTHEALIALGRCGKPGEEAGGVAVASKFLSNSNIKVTEAAVTSIAGQGSGEALVLLRDLLFETREGKALVGSTSVPLRLRTFAAYGIGIACMNEPRPAMRTFGVQALSEVLLTNAKRSRDLSSALVLGMSVIPLPQMASGEDPDAQGELAPSSSGEALFVFLESLLQDQDLHRAARGYCATALARIANRHPQLRRSALQTLLDLTDVHAKVPNEVERCAVLALGELSTAGKGRLDSQARDHLLLHTRRGDLVARHYACLALGRSISRPDASDDGFHGMHPTVSGLLRGFDKAQGRDRPFYAFALGMAGHGMSEHSQAVPPRIRTALEKRLRRFRQPMRAATIALGLGLLHDPRSGPRIEEGLKSIKDPHSQAHFVLALGMTGDSSRLPSITKLGAGAAHLPDLLEASGRARAILGDPHVSMDVGLVHASCNCPMTTAGSCAALASTRNPKNLDTLLAAAKDEGRSKSARATALRQIGRLIDQRPQSWELELGQFTSLYDAPPTLTSPSTWTGILDTRTP
ncbi:MAG TPA: hypothetical protein EYG26_14545 [Planctomycetes bacterium]|nr:hypothetical protein [Planctomycetota bacterium]